MRRVVALRLVLVGATPLVAQAHPELPALERAAGEELARDPDDPGRWLQQARVHLVGGDWDAALAAVEHAASHGADADEVTAARGRIFLGAGWARMALLEFDRVLARRPDRFAVRLERGRAALALGRRDEAARDFGAAVTGMAQPAPDDVFAWRDVLLALGRREDAVDALDVGMRRLGPVPSLALAAVDLEVALARFDAAIGRLDRLLATNPRHEAWIVRRAEVLERAGRTEAAAAAYAHARALVDARPRHRRGARVDALARRPRETEGTR
jgi:tetratricopeptide (TPR) repeat protein